MEKAQLYHAGIYDEKTVKDLISLGDPDFIRELIAIFSDNTPKYLDELEKFHQERNAWEMRQILHKMRGTCGTVGVKNMLASIEALRSSLIEEDWPSATFRLKDMQEVWAGTYPYLTLVFDLD